MNERSLSKFDGRAFVALLLAWGLLVVGVTGCSMAWSPAGPHDEPLRRGLGLTRLLHLVFGHVLALAATWHLFAYNWKPFVAYLGRREQPGACHGRELRASILVVAALALLVLPGWVACVWCQFGRSVPLG
ncbi:MAG: hypothetical protein HY814_01950 [Candidatus Riflebacteria bacterium]|nr:hypothetical protein [Candidatus Riflebacteria bacterium]